MRRSSLAWRALGGGSLAVPAPALVMGGGGGCAVGLRAGGGGAFDGRWGRCGWALAGGGGVGGRGGGARGGPAGGPLGGAGPLPLLAAAQTPAAGWRGGAAAAAPPPPPVYFPAARRHRWRRVARWPSAGGGGSAPRPVGPRPPAPTRGGGDRSGLQAMPLRLDHIALLVRDLDESAAFYTAIPGIREVPNPMGGSLFRWFEYGGGQRFHLQAGDISTTHVEKPTHFAFSADDFLMHSLVNRSPREGASPIPRFQGHARRGERSSATACAPSSLQDPNGYWIELNDLADRRHLRPLPPLTSLGRPRPMFAVSARSANLAGTGLPEFAARSGREKGPERADERHLLEWQRRAARPPPPPEQKKAVARCRGLCISLLKSYWLILRRMAS